MNKENKKNCRKTKTFGVVALAFVMISLLWCFVIGMARLLDSRYVFFNEATDTIEIGKNCSKNSDYTFCEFEDSTVIVENFLQASSQNKAEAIKNKIKLDAKKENKSVYAIFMREVQKRDEKLK